LTVTSREPEEYQYPGVQLRYRYPTSLVLKELRILSILSAPGSIILHVCTVLLSSESIPSNIKTVGDVSVKTYVKESGMNADPHPHYFGKLDPHQDPHYFRKLDTDPHYFGMLDPDPHYSEKLDPDSGA
jgi:hypothetical protein